MRCYFMRDGHIVSVKEVREPSDKEAINKAFDLFSEREDRRDLDGFALWDRARLIIRWREPIPEPSLSA